MTMTDGRTRRDGKRLEDWNIVTPDFSTPWEHVSRGPYRVQRRYTSDPEGTAHVWETTGDIEVAVGVFCEVGFPMQREATCVLIDESFAVVLGYTTMWGGLEGVGLAFWGTAETFGVLERWGDIDPLALAVWESIARRYVS